MTRRSIFSISAVFVSSALVTGLFANIDAAKAAPPSVTVTSQRSGQTCGTFPAGAARAIIGRADFSAISRKVGGDLLTDGDAGRECELSGSF
jgi:hypothetical protein